MKMVHKEEVQFEPTATPNFPMTEGRWAMVWMDDLIEVPPGAHAYQVPFYRLTDAAIFEASQVIFELAQKTHPSCSDVKVIISRGSGSWEGMSGLHVEGSL